MATPRAALHRDLEQTIRDLQDRLDRLSRQVSVGGGVSSVVEGDHVDVDATDPRHPVVSATGFVESIVEGSGVTVDATDPANPVVSASGGGGSGRCLDRRWNVGPSETSYDEFIDGTLGGSYVRVDSSGGGARVTWTETDDVLKASNTGGDSAEHLNALMLPLTSAGGSMVAGDAFSTCLVVNSAGSNYAFSGLLLADGVTFGAGNQVVATSHYGSSSRQHYLRGYTNYNNAASNVDGISTMTLVEPWFIRLVYLGGTTWRRDLSGDGRNWYKGGATLTKTITPTHVGFMTTSWGSSTASEISYEFLRRESGVT